MAEVYGKGFGWARGSLGEGVVFGRGHDKGLGGWVDGGHVKLFVWWWVGRVGEECLVLSGAVVGDFPWRSVWLLGQRGVVEVLWSWGGGAGWKAMSEGLGLGPFVLNVVGLVGVKSAYF
ncbi:hypothetical protein CsSME_00024948 [Camellia sinensis var. sinensis]